MTRSPSRMLKKATLHPPDPVGPRRVPSGLRAPLIDILNVPLRERMRLGAPGAGEEGFACSAGCSCGLVG